MGGQKGMTDLTSKSPENLFIPYFGPVDSKNRVPGRKFDDCDLQMSHHFLHTPLTWGVKKNPLGGMKRGSKK